ncbi:hypothetical protein MCOR02_005246 [Pyricularia oryzae]|nr:hypothetical protein MCOR02_005246 [Pyricularia oryzae]KAI6394037.1 hypothetical protein MCOR24_009617 [Pyricularia oryzae]KAI6473630.1 hypothetical protein MCOR18_008183 [Pyricularia oryzae]KAI6534594.1 hypothetical protein MCOR05_006288 [Pyricularia oryzae]
MQWLSLALLAVNAFIPSVYAIPGKFCECTGKPSDNKQDLINLTQQCCGKTTFPPFQVLAGNLDTKLNQCDYSNNVQFGTLQPEDASKAYAACCSATSGQKLEAACRFSRL